MPRLRSFSRLSLVALLLVVCGSVAWAKPKVAILGLEAANSGVVDPKDAANAARLTEELRSIPRGGVGKYDFAPNSNRELQDEKLMGNCDTEKPACMAPIGGGLGADYLVYGNIVKGTDKTGKEGYRTTLKILNVKAKAVEETSETFIPVGAFSGGNGVKDWAQKVYAKLSGEKPPPPERVETGPGKLAITASNATSGDVFIGGAKKGRLDGGTLTLTLPPGPQELAIEAPGHKRYEATITIVAGQTKTIEAVLEEVAGLPPPGGGGGKGGNRLALKVAGYGLAAVAVGGGLYAGYLTVLGPIPKYEDLKSQPIDPETNMEAQATSGDCNNSLGKRLRGFQKSMDGSTNAANVAFDEACSASKSRLVVGIIAAITGAAGVGTLYFAYRSESKAGEKQTSIGRRTRRQLTVTPVVSPSGGGATVRFDW